MGVIRDISSSISNISYILSSVWNAIVTIAGDIREKKLIKQKTDKISRMKNDIESARKRIESEK